MGLRDKWKDAGKNTGKAFGQLGKALGHTAKEIFSDDEKEEGDATLGKDWREVGHNFKDAGKSIGSAADDTGKKITKKDKKDVKAANEDDIIDNEAQEVKQIEEKPAEDK